MSTKKASHVFLKSFILSVFILGAVAALVFVFLIQPRQQPEEPTQPDETATTTTTTTKEEKPVGGKFNVLLLGTDGSDLRTDTMMLVCVDKDNKLVNITSIPRDTRIKIKGKYHKLNACVPYGGLDLLFEKIEELTGAPIHYYAKVDFEGFREVIDILGGVEIDVAKDMKYKDPAQNLNINIKAGLQVMDGKTAEGYVRYRRYVEGDVERTRVQQQFIKELIRQKLKPEYLLKAPEIYESLVDHVETNFTAMDLLINLPALALFSGDNVYTYEMPGEGKMVGNVSYFIHDPDATYEMFQEHFLGTGDPNKESE